jgi:hypothetical protein
MPTLLGGQSTPIDDTTMVIYRGSRKPINPERKRDLAKRCGVDFIRLRYKDRLTTPVGVSGFQHVKLRSQPRKGGGVEPVAQWHQNAFTLQPMAEGSMDFVPDEMGTGVAYLPDSAFNRVRLAYAEIAQNATWDIDDKRTELEIKELANQIRESIEYREKMEELNRAQTEVAMKVKQDGVATGMEHKTRIQIEVGVLEEQVKEMELKKRRDELKKRIAELQGNHPELINNAEDGVDAAEDIKEKEPSPPEDDLSDLLEELAKEDVFEEDAERLKDAFKNQAKTEIHNANKELIEQIKKSYFKETGKNRGWVFSSEYRSKIGPLISARLQELINEHTATSIPA